jgi:hypothetical protein
MNLVEIRVRRSALLACFQWDEQRPGGLGNSKEYLDPWEDKDPEGEIPGATPLEIAGRREGEQGVKRDEL